MKRDRENEGEEDGEGERLRETKNQLLDRNLIFSLV